jgi:hypothetical protein
VAKSNFQAFAEKYIIKDWIKNNNRSAKKVSNTEKEVLLTDIAAGLGNYNWIIRDEIIAKLCALQDQAIEDLQKTMKPAPAPEPEPETLEESKTVGPDLEHMEYDPRN